MMAVIFGVSYFKIREKNMKSKAEAELKSLQDAQKI